MATYIGTGIVAIFKRAICDALKGDAAVSAFVADRVFDITPSKVAPPYIFLGPLGGKWDRSAVQCGFGFDVRIRIVCVSTLPQRDHAWDIAQKVILALNEKKLTLNAGQWMSELELFDAGDVVDPLDPKFVYCDFVTKLRE